MEVSGSESGSGRPKTYGSGSGTLVNSMLFRLSKTSYPVQRCLGTKLFFRWSIEPLRQIHTSALKNKILNKFSILCGRILIQEAFENVGMSMFGYMTDIEKVRMSCFIKNIIFLWNLTWELSNYNILLLFYRLT
jgi:hypothetical protein